MNNTQWKCRRCGSIVDMVAFRCNCTESPSPWEPVIEGNEVDNEYKRLLQTILENGREKKNRTGVDTIGVFGEQAKFDVRMDAFPILTTKKVWFKGIVHELLWFIKGDTNIKYLVDNDVHIWDEWAYVRYKKAGVYLDDECWNQDSQGVETYTQKVFIERIKEDAQFAEKWGELGEGTYGGMWRAFPYNYINSDGKGGGEMVLNGRVDQLQKVIDKLKTNPDDRRMIVSAWHPYWVDHCALPPCHCLFHFNTEELTDLERCHIAEAKGCNVGWTSVHEINEREYDRLGIPKRRLNLLLYQRSCDTFLGVPFNITSYSLLLAMVAHCVGMEPGTFTHTYGDLHIYENHKDQVNEQLSRSPKKLPKLWLNPNIRDLFSFTFNDIRLEGYDPHSAIKGQVAV